MKVVRIGTMIKATSSDDKNAIINVPAKGPKVLPTNPYRNRRGTKTASVVALPATIAN